jgi:hypothetical protein
LAVPILVSALATVDVTVKSTSSGAEIKSRPNVVVIVVIALLPKNSKTIVRAFREGCDGWHFMQESEVL